MEDEIKEIAKHVRGTFFDGRGKGGLRKFASEIYNDEEKKTSLAEFYKEVRGIKSSLSQKKINEIEELVIKYAFSRIEEIQNSEIVALIKKHFEYRKLKENLTELDAFSESLKKRHEQKRIHSGFGRVEEWMLKKDMNSPDRIKRQSAQKYYENVKIAKDKLRDESQDIDNFHQLYEQYLNEYLINLKQAFNQTYSAMESLNAQANEIRHTCFSKLDKLNISDKEKEEIEREAKIRFNNLPQFRQILKLFDEEQDYFKLREKMIEIFKSKP